jgi:hypothetical protein
MKSRARGVFEKFSRGFGITPMLAYLLECGIVGDMLFYRAIFPTGRNKTHSVRMRRPVEMAAKIYFCIP